MAPRRRAFIIGDRLFGTQKEAEEHMRAILQAATLGQPLDQDSEADVISLLQNHPDAEAKIGVGVDHICVQLNRVWGTNRHFVIVRTDGSTTDFSFKKCITPPTPIRLFKSACRDVVADQVIAFRNSALDRAASSSSALVCPVLGISITRDTAHVDHEPPWTFDRLVEDFVARERVDVAKVQLTGFGDNELRKGFADAALAARWQHFHKTNAHLRLVSREANLSAIRCASRRETSFLQG